MSEGRSAVDKELLALCGRQSTVGEERWTLGEDRLTVHTVDNLVVTFELKTLFGSYDLAN